MRLATPRRKVMLLFTGIVLIALILATIVTARNTYDKAHGAYSEFKAASRKVDALELEVFRLKQITSVEKSTPVVSASNAGTSLIFAGHIYPYNENVASQKYVERPKFSADSSPIKEFIDIVNQLSPDRVIFGGDSVWAGNRQSLEFLSRTVKEAITAESRFVIGNHDMVQTPGQDDELFQKIFNRSNYFEDIGDLRLVYLNSVRDDFMPGLPDDRLAFLKSALTGPYRTAIVFLHHSLWLAGLPDSYVNSPYTGVDPSLWFDKVIQLLVDGRVAAVIAGDGGVRQPALVTNICNIPHYVSGWSFDITKRPAELLQIGYNNRDIDITVATIIDGVMYPASVKLVAVEYTNSCTAAPIGQPE